MDPSVELSEGTDLESSKSIGKSVYESIIFMHFLSAGCSVMMPSSIPN